MVVRDVEELLESWAPRQIAWERDNVGLQCGSPGRRVRRVMVTLDVTDAVLAEAEKKRVDLIVSHHPLLFHPLKAIGPDDRVGRLITQLVKENIALIVAHTNLDFARDGVSFALAGRLGLRDIGFLYNDQRVSKKVVVFVPAGDADRVRSAMAAAGAGVIGAYEECSFAAGGTGTFRPLAGAKPFIGRAGNLESVPEMRLEMVVPAWKLEPVLSAMRAAHPYEEVAVDVYDLATPSPGIGAGAIGSLRRPLALRAFLRLVQRRLRIPALRFRGSDARRIRTVAVCGGGGADLLAAAIRRGADAYVTADLGYHRFEEADERIVLVDAGHYETEVPVVSTLAGRLSSALSARREPVHVFTSTAGINPVHYFV